LFFSIFGGTILFFAIFGESHEYDLKLVLPIDTRQMPKPLAAPEVLSREIDAGSAIPEGRAESKPLLTTPARAPVQFGNRLGAASEASGQ
jgi:hypothetical protein